MPSVQFGSVTQLCLTLQRFGWQHARLPCPSPTPGACSNSCVSSQGCHPTISSSTIPFSSCFNLSQHQVRSQFFASGGQSIGASASTSILPMTIQEAQSNKYSQINCFFFNLSTHKHIYIIYAKSETWLFRESLQHRNQTENIILMHLETLLEYGF